MNESILTIVNLFILYWLWDKGFRKFMLDKHRHNLFMIRHNLFLMASKNNTLNSISYIQVRDIVNSNIRFAHKLNIFYIFYTRKRIDGFDENIKTIDKRVKYNIRLEKNEESRNFYTKTIEDINYVSTKYLIKTSPIIWARFAIYFIKVFAKNFVLSLNVIKSNLKISILKYQSKSPKSSIVAFADDTRYDDCKIAFNA